MSTFILEVLAVQCDLCHRNSDSNPCEFIEFDSGGAVVVEGNKENSHVCEYCAKQLVEKHFECEDKSAAADNFYFNAFTVVRDIIAAQWNDPTMAAPADTANKIITELRRLRVNLKKTH